MVLRAMETHVLIHWLIQQGYIHIGLTTHPYPGIINRKMNEIWYMHLFIHCYLVIQSCPTLCNPMDCSPPGSSVCGISQARILEWVAIPFSSGSSQQELNLHFLQADSLPLSHHRSGAKMFSSTEGTIKKRPELTPTEDQHLCQGGH